MVFLEATNIDAFALQQNFFNTRKYFVLCAQILIQQAFQQNAFLYCGVVLLSEKSLN
jgi:hypothetical protein